MRIMKNLVFFFSLVLHMHMAFSQFEPTPVERSNSTTVINGVEFYLHKVLAGQTLFGISRAYGVSIDEIVAANSHLPEIVSNLRVAMEVRIPARLQGQTRRATHQAAPQNARGQGAPPNRQLPSPQILRQQVPLDTIVNHTVARGETLFGIARQYQVSQESILVLNPAARQGLRPRQVIRIPVKRPRMVEFFQYEVQAGESLEELAGHFGIPMNELMQINPEIQPNAYVSGILLRIPARASGVALPTARQTVAEINNLQQVATSNDAYCANPQLKSSYNVAVLIPLHLDQFLPENRNIQSSHVSFSFLQFYQGILIAADSIRQKGISINLHVYDVGREAHAVTRLLNQADFRQMDLIIGPFFPEPLKVVAEFGERNGIAVVSPFYNDISILRGNPNLIQVTPSMQTQLESVAEYIARNYHNQNIILVHNNQTEALEIINNFRRRLTNDLIMTRTGGSRNYNGFATEFLERHGLVGSGRIAQNQNSPLNANGQHLFHEVVYRTGGFSAIQNRLDPNRRNVIVTLIGGEAFVSNYLRQLDLVRNRFDIAVIGTPQWLEYQTINLRLFESLGVYNFMSEFADYRDEHTRNFVTKFRNTFRTEPNSDAFNGVRTGYFFFNALGSFGKEFPLCMQLLNAPSYTNSFHFRRLPGEGWENIKFVLFRQVGFRQEDVTRQEMLSP